MANAERVLQIQFPTRRYVLSACRSDSGVLELFAPTEARVPMKSPVRLLITFGDSPQRFELAGA